MFFRCHIGRYIVHSPRGINFNLSADDAVKRIHDKYGRRWFGARLDYLGIEAPAKEFLPFYLCSGRIHATYVGTITYAVNNTGKSENVGGSSTQTVTTLVQTMDSVFEENKTQIYGGYKYNNGHVHSALRADELAYSLRKMHEVDTTGATINLFEQSTVTMTQILEQEVRRQARETAMATLRSFHPSAQSVSISFKEFTFHIDEVTPTFVPCFIVKADYDQERYTLYVSGVNGQVGGPYLLNALFIARTTALATVAAALLLTPNKVAGLVFGSVASVLTYYVAFYAARYYPVWRRNRNREQREKLRAGNLGVDAGGYRPQTTSQRIQKEYSTSSYWDTHPFQKRKSTFERHWQGSASSSSSSTFTDAGAQRSSDGSGSDQDGRATSSSKSRAVADRQGYYRTLGLRGDESINEIRSAYRQVVLKVHPDVGGTDKEMAKVNEAYRVLRDPKRREAYDRS